MTTSYSSRDADKFVLRMPDGFRDEIAVLAKESERSMNSEMICRLKKSVTQDKIVQDQEKVISLLLERIAHLEARLHPQQTAQVA